METLSVDLGERSYPIHIGDGLLGQADLFHPAAEQGRVLVVTNEVVAPLYLDRVMQHFSEGQCESLVLPDGEQHKHLETVGAIYDRLLDGRFDRKTTLVALGGGVIGDIVGFAAATYQRGVRFVQVPTTLLAQVDSSVGGKTGVNHPRGKNMIGAFYQPVSVIIDTAVLHSLPEREVKAGLAEVLKYGLLGDRDFFDWLAANAAGILQLDDALMTRVIKTCCLAKADVVARDEKESGVRALLNLGHTFGHAIETASGYGTLLHGETVAMGMVMAADLSRRIGWLDAPSAARVRDVLESKFFMPVIPPADISGQKYLELMATDKKAEQGRIRFVLLENLGKASLTAEVDPDLLQQTLAAGDQLCR